MINNKFKLLIVIGTSIFITSCSVLNSTKEETFELISDVKIESSIYSDIANIPSFKNNYHNINVVSWNNTIILLGFAKNEIMINELYSSVIKKYPNNKVINEVKLRPSYPISELAIDSKTTSLIKSKLLLTKNINSLLIKVLTFDGNVYILSSKKIESQKNIITDIAKSVYGVKKIYTYFN